MRPRRGALVTTIAMLLSLVAIIDLIKALTTPPPPGHQPMGLPPTGIVFLGVRHTGTAETVLGPILAAILLWYAVGVWRMKRYALTMAWIYAAYVILNVALFAKRNPLPQTPGAAVFAVAYLLVVVIFAIGAAIALSGRRLDLS